MSDQIDEIYQEGAEGSPQDDLAQALGGSSEEPYFAEGKKSGNNRIMMLVGVALIGAGVLLFTHLRRGPASAEAATTGKVQQTDQTISQFLTDGARNIAQMEKMLRNTERVVNQFRTYPSAAQLPLSELRTNPFRFHELRDAPEDTGMAQRKREEERAEALKAVAELSLQSIMHSDTHKACMINNQLYKEGQQINAFTVDRIGPDSVIVRSGAYRFELKMQ